MMAASTPKHDPMDNLVDYEPSAEDAPEEPREGSPSSPGLAAAAAAGKAPAETVAGVETVPAVYSAAITPSHWAALPAELKADMIMKAPLTFQNVHTLDEEALVLQRRLEDEASREAIRLATVRQTKGRSKPATLKEAMAKLGQQLASAEREVALATTDTETHDKEVEAAESSGRDLEDRRRPRRNKQASRMSQSRVTPSPRTYRHAVTSSPAYVPRPVDSIFMDTALEDFIAHTQPSFAKEMHTNVRVATHQLLGTFEAYAGATLRQVLRHVVAAPDSAEVASAAHALVELLRRTHLNDSREEAVWSDRSGLGVGAAASPHRQAGPSPCHGRRDAGRDGRQGRTSDGSNSSRQHGAGKQTRREDNSSSSSAPSRRTKTEPPKEEPEDSEDVTALKTPR